MAFQIGDHAGDYEIIGILGSGGMGKVYKVKNQLSNRIEAMKVLLPSLAESADLADRFLQEIRVQATLEHPNIASLHTAQRLDNQVLMIMEYVEGTSLDVLLHQGRQPLDKALDYGSQVLSALEYAHSRGIVHRDVKPANMIVTPAGVLKLMDFGIAKLAVDRKLTVTGTTIGSLYYMSPEQIQGAHTVDARSDLYSLAICLYEMVTGKRPFNANSEYGLMAAHLKEGPRPPIELEPSLPEALSEIILIGMAKDPEKRFQSAAAMRSALNTVRQGPGGDVTVLATAPVPPHPAPSPPPWPAPPSAIAAPSRRRGLYMTVGSLVTIGVLIAAVVFLPKYFRTDAAKGNVPSSTGPAPQTGSSQAVSTPAAPEEPKTVSPGTAQRSRPSPGSVNAPPAPAVSAPSRSSPHESTVTAQQTPAPGPAPSAPPPTAAADSTPPRSPLQPSQAPPETAQPKAGVTEAREQYNQLAIRANTAKGGLQSLQNQMGGLGLRADMLEAKNRMDYLMQEALNNIRAGDVEAARRNMDLADRSIEKIEKFLGR